MHEKRPKEAIETDVASFDFGHLLTRLGEVPSGGPKFIHIGGASSAGKSTISRLLAAQLPDAQVLSIDSYLREGLGKMAGRFDDTPPNPSRPYVGGISPKVWELDLLGDQLSRLHNGKSVRVPVYDETIKDRMGYRPLAPGQHIILEGGHSFTPRFQEFSSYNVLIQAPLHDRLTRKIVRTHAIYHRNDLDDIVGRYLTKDEPVWRIYESEYRGMADQIVNNPANPRKEYARLPSASFVPVTTRSYRLRPKPETGVEHPEEVFMLRHDTGASIFHLAYGVAGRTLVHLPVASEVAAMLSDHYDLTEESSHAGQ